MRLSGQFRWLHHRFVSADWMVRNYIYSTVEPVCFFMRHVYSPITSTARCRPRNKFTRPITWKWTGSKLWFMWGEIICFQHWSKILAATDVKRSVSSFVEGRCVTKSFAPEVSRPVHFLSTSCTIYAVAQRRTTEEQTPNPHRCENVLKKTSQIKSDREVETVETRWPLTQDRDCIDGE
jgi:hypothetical protein